MNSKNALTSKTAVGNLLLAVVVGFVPGAKEFIANNPEGSVAAISLLNILLRFVTNRGIHFPGIKAPAMLALLFVPLIFLALPSCAGLSMVRLSAIQPKFTADGCALVGSELSNGQTVWVGICNDDRLVVQWDSPQPDALVATIRATRWPSGRYAVRYSTGDSGWLEWSSKAGIFIGPLPPQAEEFIALPD